ncbi:C6 zinc cluster transcription factor-like protein [Knufia obscura]|uniref:C6 zinc cluster transcription factor-like protein n=2 Tax=Knufia TaxID=430999 RepID=A0AAN8I4Y2_9EURO|nr:C6 zinc cluster transcription factor-like protein [Knufia obscura]KAK5949641.1 C6 zinc cluster transcription factor-like protein [Knufia fluminis]
MPVTEILLLRHGHRIAWTLDPTTGKYTANHPFPTKLPADPPLASHGVDQAVETGTYLAEQLGELAKQDRLRVYSSLFYRCLQTLKPTVERLRSIAAPNLQVRGERGFGEWFGHAWFEQPVPAEAARLKEEFYSFVDEQYQSKIIPDRHGERIEEIHDRIAKAFTRVIQDIDQEYESVGRGSEAVTLLICGHAAQIICSGRVLTGEMPEDLDDEDFKCFTCGISKFQRRNTDAGYDEEDWRGKGVTGGWDCILNSWCGHLSGGEERGWHFHGDESFDSYGPGLAQGPITVDGGVREASDAKL